MTAALTLDGIVAPMMLHGAMNGRAFDAHVEQCLARELQPGDVVVLNKLGAHRPARVRDLVEARGARLVHLPSYSPDFNPIEHAWTKLKALLRKAGVRTVRKLARALRFSLLAITPDDSHGWFSHCGFRVPCSWEPLLARYSGPPSRSIAPKTPTCDESPICHRKNPYCIARKSALCAMEPPTCPPPRSIFRITGKPLDDAS